MSKQQTQTIACPGCGSAGEFVLWNSINADLDPQAKDDLMSGSLTRFVCEECGKVNEVVYPLLYHDMRGKQMIYMTAGGDSSETESMRLEILEGYRFRTVDSRNELMEKILIGNAGLDDRLVEIFKLLLRSQTKAEDECVFLFAGTREDDALHFVMVGPNGKEMLSVPRDSFNETADKLSAYVKFAETIPGEWHRVNGEFAMRALATVNEWPC